MTENFAMADSVIALFECCWNSGESGIRVGCASREARGELCLTTQGKQARPSIVSLIFSCRLVGLRGDKEGESLFSVDNCLGRVADRSNEAAESCGVNIYTNWLKGKFVNLRHQH